MQYQQSSYHGGKGDNWYGDKGFKGGKGKGKWDHGYNYNQGGDS